MSTVPPLPWPDPLHPTSAFPDDWPWPQMPDGQGANTLRNPNADTVPANATVAGTAWLRNAKLVDAVGPMQPNHAIDVALLQRLINEAYSRGYIKPFHMPDNADGPNHSMAVNGIWQPGAPINRAILDLEKLYFHGRANPRGMGVVDPGGELFTFLVQIVQLQRQAEQHLAVGMEQLGDKMLHTGKSGKPTKEQLANVHQYLPALLDALTKRQLNDTEMVLVCLSNIAAESTAFAPVDEGISKYNTEGYRSAPDAKHPRGVFVPTGTPYGLYNNRASLQNGPNDGPLFFGRGFTQLTGRYNYNRTSNDLGTPGVLTNDPALADDPQEASEIMAQYLKQHEAALRDALQRNDLHEIRAIVNGKKELGYETFRTSFNAGRAFVGETIITEAQAVAARAARPKPPKRHKPQPAKAAAHRHAPLPKQHK